MPRKPRITRTPAETKEILDQTINVSGAGEDPAIKALMSPEFVKAKDLDALQVALVLQEILRGQDSIRTQIEAGNVEVAEQLRKFQSRLDAYDKKNEQYENDRAKFLADVQAQADKVRLTGEAKDKAIAQGAEQFQKALADARASAITSRLAFDAKLANMPTEMVVSPGHLEIVLENGAQIPKIFPEEVRIKHRRWIIPPGKLVEVPVAVANVLRERRRLEEEQAERKEVLAAQLQDDKLGKRWAEIDRKYGVQSNDPLPVASSSSS